MEAYFSQTIFLPKFHQITKLHLIHTSLISARSENQSILEVFCDKDSESRRFHFDQGTYPRLSQSNVHHTQVSLNPTPRAWFFLGTALALPLFT